MADFWDLPRPIRDRIYRLNLRRGKPIDLARHERITRRNKRNYNKSNKYSMPPLLESSKKAEKEAAPIYYGENWFDVGNVREFREFSSITWPRHLKLVRKIVCQWVNLSYGGGWGSYGLVRESFVRMSKMHLQKLRIGVDEAVMLKELTVSREIRQRSSTTDLTPQQQLAILRFPGMTGLLAITNVEDVRFVKAVDEKGKKYGGPIDNGPLQTYIQPRLRPRVAPGRRRRNKTFPFLELPAEMRNRVYDLLLRIPGPIHPSTEPPTSAPKKEDKVAANESANHGSALSILAVNKQMHDEAIGTFYNANDFIFYYPVQLHAFLLSIGPQRQCLLQSLTIHYHNLKIGGIDLINLTFPMLKELKCLKKLRIEMVSSFHETTLRAHWLHISYARMHGIGATVLIGGANPGLIPGIKNLFELRGLTEISIRDIPLEEEIEDLKKDSAYPDFSSNSKGHQENRKYLQIARAYKHFNAALVDAQRGKINAALLEDNLWHLEEWFPEIDTEDDEDDDESGEDGDDVEEEGDDDEGQNDEVGEDTDEDDPDHDSDSDYCP